MLAATAVGYSSPNFAPSTFLSSVFRLFHEFLYFWTQQLPGVFEFPVTGLGHKTPSGLGVEFTLLGTNSSDKGEFFAELLRGLFHGFWIKWDITITTGTGKEPLRKRPFISHLNDHCLAQHKCHKSPPLILSRSDCSERSLLSKAQRVWDVKKELLKKEAENSLETGVWLWPSARGSQSGEISEGCFVFYGAINHGELPACGVSQKLLGLEITWLSGWHGRNVWHRTRNSPDKWAQRGEFLTRVEPN